MHGGMHTSQNSQIHSLLSSSAVLLYSRTVLVRAETSAVRLQSAQRRLSKTRYGRTTVYGRTSFVP
jgi:hypothetical protein